LLIRIYKVYTFRKGKGENAMEKAVLEQLTVEEQKLLLNLLFNQHYALELVSCEIADIESGYKQVEESHYKKLIKLYDRLRETSI
jgi:hypothetical protein